MFKKKLIASLCVTLFLIFFGVYTLHKYQSWRKNEASLKGISWLITHNDEMGTSNSLIEYKKVYKVTADQSVAEKMLNVIRDERTRIKVESLFANPSYSGSQNWTNLEPLAISILNEQCAGKEVNIKRDTLKNMFLLEKDQMLSSLPGYSSSILATLYFLEKTGIPDQNFRNQAINYLEKSNGDSLFDLYGLTHIIFTDSDYFSSYLDPFNYPWEIEIFNETLKKYLGSKILSSSEADILSEIILSLKLLHEDKTEDIEIISQKLVNLQNEDGSWGSANEPIESREHHTIVSTLALMNFASNFRKADVFCTSN